MADADLGGVEILTLDQGGDGAADTVLAEAPEGQPGLPPGLLGQPN